MRANVYRPSGKVVPAFFVYLLVLLLIGIPVLSVAYIYLIFYIPLIYVNILVTLVCGGALGLLVGHAAKLGKARNPFLVMLFAFLAMILLKYVQWAIYVPLVFTNAYEIFDWTFFERLTESAHLVFEPRALWFGMDFINEFGVWSIGDGDVVNGTMLWVVWAGEFLIMAACAIAVAAIRPKTPFSEEHGAWYTEVHDTVIHFDPPEDVNALREQVLAGNFTSLVTQVQKGLSEGALSYMKLNFHAPPEGSFSEPYFMTLSSSVTTEKGRRRKRSETKAKTIARFVAVDRHKFRELTIPPLAEAPENVFDMDENDRAQRKFSLMTDAKEYTNDEISTRLFEEILDGLIAGTWDFMTLSPDRPIENSTYIQVALTADEAFEMNIGFGETQTEYKMYSVETQDKNLVLQYFVDYRDRYRIPDISSWDDISDILPK